MDEKTTELYEHFMENIKKNPDLLEELKDRIENDEVIEKGSDS